jgi:hypothetical protein
MQIPRQCPLVLVLKVGWKESKKSESKEGRDKSGAKIEVEWGPTDNIRHN